MAPKKLAAFFLGLILIPAFFAGTPSVTAQTVEELQQQIAEKQARQKEIEAEIKELESSLNQVGAQKDTLQKAINQLELERKKVLADIKSTQNKIDSADLTIDKLSNEIGSTESDIADAEAAIAEILRNIEATDDDSMIEILLRTQNLSEFWDEVESLATVRDSMNEQVHLLTTLKQSLEGKRLTETEQKELLEQLKKQYTGQQTVLESNKTEKNKLLQQTKSQEANYQTLLAQKKAESEKLQAEVQDFESQLQFILDPSSIPSKGSAVFQWPLATFTLTQYFGYTKFALANPGVYKNNMHNGIDLATPVGSKVMAPLSGTIRATGNTDLVSGCYSWGKWILIDHPNGLSSLFAHLSAINVEPGQNVATGEVVAFSGNTGYSTGPHLHFTVYATDAVTVKKFSEFKTVTGCGAAYSPFAAVEGYLDPLDYLPSL
jgi:murein DD-endopeptidase MepM/ murein hydrolase activator NlpD